MIKIINCTQYKDGQLSLAYRREPDDGLYHDLLLGACDKDRDAAIWMNPETASELIANLQEFISIMEGRKK